MRITEDYIKGYEILEQCAKTKQPLHFRKMNFKAQLLSAESGIKVAVTNYCWLYDNKKYNCFLEPKGDELYIAGIWNKEGYWSDGISIIQPSNRSICILNEGDIYRTTIIVKDSLSEAERKEFREFCIKAHDNKEGCVEIKDISDREFVFESEKPRGRECLTRAFLDMSNDFKMVDKILSWQWEDRDPSESDDLLEIAKRFIKRKPILDALP